MNAEILVLPDGEALAVEAAGRVREAGRRAMAERGRFTLVLSGGSTPRRLYQLLSEEDAPQRLDWSAVEIFFGDERCVPPNDAASNFRMVRESLLDGLPAPPAGLHRIHGELAPPAAADLYERELRECLGPGVPRFDLVLLGLGEDGHTASLFPGSPALDERERLVVPSVAPVMPSARVTLTLPVLQAAREIVFLVSGPQKAAPLAQVLGGRTGEKGEPPPAALVQLRTGRLVWLVDQAAARIWRKASP
jgi:6-phosphogluconolactonase